MAVIPSMPSEAIISGFKGTIDYYLHWGIACVRSWPRSPGRSRTPAVEAQWEAFAYVAKAWKDLPSDIQAVYNSQAVGTSYTGRDLFERGYLSGLYAYPTGAP